ncbi:sensor histidine kinase [Ilumatobacter sp.]|uniref:sensor histidine kinase n=1 Tax=Ilumatobacter sp. TaxID=1967498 RepID=UPI0037505E02
MSRLSLRARLLAGFGLVAIVLVAVAAVITVTTRTQLISQLDQRLAAASSGGPIGDGDDDDHGGADGGHIDIAPGGQPERQSDFYEGTINADGTLTTFFVPNVGRQNLAPPDVSLDGLGDRSRRFLTSPATEGDIEYRLLLERNGDIVRVTGLPLNELGSTIEKLRWVTLGGLAGVLAILGLVTWWMLRLGIRPIKQMTATATTIAGGDLSARADESAAAAESHELAVALNTMLSTLQTALTKREESETRLRQFVSDASHELRTPVTTIRGYAELYRAGGLSEPEQLDDAMRRTEQESIRMARLVEDMLNLAKLDEHRPIEQRAVDIAQLAHDAVTDAHAVTPARSITIEAPHTAIVQGDNDRLRQVLANLVNNAVIHTDDNVPVTVTVHPPEHGRVLIDVADAGPGIPADVVEHITERFFRADVSRSRRRGGSGLGLSIVESTVAAHGGTIRIDSTPGIGTTVTVDLPVTPA